MNLTEVAAHPLARLPEQPVTWWVWLWGANMVALLAALFFLPFRWWAIAALVGFGTMEGIGVFASHMGGRYWPPLTDVIRSYLPAWVAFPAIYALVAWAGGYWFGWRHPLWVGVLVGLLGWFTAHFDGTYDKPKEQP